MKGNGILGCLLTSPIRQHAWSHEASLL
jgi:hypothetical protein